MTSEQNDILTRLDRRMSRIENYLQNDEHTGQAGAIQKLDSLEQRMADMEQREKYAKGWKAGLIFIGGLIVGLAQLLIKHLPNWLK